MGIINKFKEMFFDDEEESVKEEVEQVKKETYIEDKKEDGISDDTSEKNLYKSPSTFKFPVIFEEEDMKPQIQQPVVSSKTYTFDKSKIKDKNSKVEEKKFTPSLIISPIYGILDKNYKQDEILQRTENVDTDLKRNYRKVDIDSIRQKAFGTLEDDLEQTILEDRGFIYGLKDEDEEHDSLVTAMGLNDKETEEVKEDVSIEAAYENYSDYGHEYQKEVKAEIDEEKHQNTEVLGDELYSLINSMYNTENDGDDQ